MKIFNPKDTTKFYKQDEATQLAKDFNIEFRYRVMWKYIAIAFAIGLVALGALYQNLRIGTELNLLKQEMQMKEALGGTQSNAKATSTSETTQTPPIPKGQ